MVRIKVCGITSERDALESVHLGVDALGFVFDPGSPCAIGHDEAARIASRLPPFVARVGVFRDAPPATIRKVMRAAGLGVVQLDGEESADRYARLGWPVIKTVVVGAGFDVRALAEAPGSAYRILGAEGVDPETVWRAAGAARRYGRVLLAGGLEESALADAVRQADPYGLDFSEEIEFTAGMKDIDKLERLVAAVRRPRTHPSPDSFPASRRSPGAVPPRSPGPRPGRYTVQPGGPERHR